MPHAAHERNITAFKIKQIGRNEAGFTAVNLVGKEINDALAKQLAEALEKNTTLHKLDLDDNLIGDEGATAIGAALEKNTTLVACQPWR